MNFRSMWLSPMRIVAGVAATVQFSLLARAQLDITRRDPALVRGSKRRWRLICLVNFVGPLAYFRWGRVDPAGVVGMCRE